LKEQGFQIRVAEDVFIHHFGSASFSRLDSRAYWQLFQTNLHKLEEKWGFRWMPPCQRPEFIPEKLRENLDAALFFAESIASQEDQIAALRQHAQQLNRQLTDQTALANSLKMELEGIRQSNGWAFLMFLRRVRRFLFPDGSGREKVYRFFIKFIRGPRRQGIVQ